MTFAPGQEVAVHLLGLRGDIGTVVRTWDDAYVMVRLHVGGTVTAPARFVSPLVDINIDMSAADGGPA